MANPNIPSIADLKRAIEIAETTEKLQAQLAALVGGSSIATLTPKLTAAVPAKAAKAAKPAGRKGGKRQLSPEARDRIATAQRARWAKVRGTSKKAPAPAPAPTAAPVTKKEGKKPKKRVLTAAGRASLSAALKARWAARKKGEPALNQKKK